MAKQNKTPKTPDPKEPDDQDDDQDQEDQNEDPAEANRRINAIVTSRVKREMKGVLSQLAELTNLVKSQAQPKKTDDDQEDDDQEDEVQETPAKGKKAVDPKLAKQMTKLERELAEERDARKKAEQAQKDQEEKSRHQEMHNQFDSALQEHGVTDPKLRRAALITLEQDGLMIRDEDGKVKFKGTDKWGTETNLDPKIGLRGWVTGEGKSFVPAVEASGSGQGGARGGDKKYTKGDIGKMSDSQKAAIELERASSGLPPLE